MEPIQPSVGNSGFLQVKSEPNMALHPCPSCGHCPTCGRGGYGFWPYRPYPYWGYPPYYVSNTAPVAPYPSITHTVTAR